MNNNKNKEEIEFRILESKGKALLDREIMETFLSAVHERPQAQEIAKNLVNTYAGVGRILGREMDDLKVIEGVTDSAVAMIMCVKETLERVLREKLKSEPIMDLQGLVEYLNVSIGHSERECVKILYLNKRRQLIGEESYIGEMEKAPVYIKEITRKALIKNATLVIMSRNHYEQTFSNDIYRLDVAVLGETETHTKDYKGIYERSHQWYNLKALYPLPQSLLPEIKFAKAQIVLSDSWNLGEINACFPVGSIEEEGNKFVLGNDKLSGQRWNLKHKPILERFSVTHNYKVENYTDQKITKYVLAEHNIYYKNDLDKEQKDSIHELEKHILVFYPGVLKWHEHRHLHRSWKNSQAICIIS